MEKDAIYVGDDDMHLFPLWYLQQVEGYRTDVLILSRTSFYKQWYYDNLEKRNIPQFHLPPFRESMVPKDIMLAQAFLDKQLFALYAMNLAERSCYFYQKYPLRINPPLRVTRVGLLYRVSLTPFENTIQTEDYPYIPSPVSYQYQLGLQPQGERDFWRNWAVERLSDYHDLEGRYWMAQLNMDNAEANFLQSIDLNPFNAEGHYDLGMYYLSTGNNQQARDSFGRALYINPQMEKARKEIQKL
jgi:tetratricopeptide (TPR) repeat protein